MPFVVSKVLQDLCGMLGSAGSFAFSSNKLLYFEDSLILRAFGMILDFDLNFSKAAFIYLICIVFWLVKYRSFHKNQFLY